MLDRAAAALKSDETKALRDFNDTNNKLFHDRDLYISCFNTSDGKFTAFPGPGMVGMDVRTFKLGDDPIGQRAFDSIQATLEGTVSTIDYDFPKAGSPPSSSPFRLASVIRAAASLFTNNRRTCFDACLKFAPAMVPDQVAQRPS